MSSYKIQRYIVDEGKYDRMLMTNDIEGFFKTLSVFYTVFNFKEPNPRNLLENSISVLRKSQDLHKLHTNSFLFPCIILKSKYKTLLLDKRKFLSRNSSILLIIYKRNFSKRSSFLSFLRKFYKIFIRQKDPNLQKNLEQFFAVDNEKKPYAMKKSLVKFFDSPYSQMGTLKNKDPTIFAQNPEIFKRNLDPYPYINPNQNPNTSNSQYVSNAMNQERAKIRSHENKMQFFFEKNIEDYAKPLQKQDQIFKKTLIDSRIFLLRTSLNNLSEKNLPFTIITKIKKTLKISLKINPLFIPQENQNLLFFRRFFNMISLVTESSRKRSLFVIPKRIFMGSL
jgi:hypothetical protein